jgi:hypothetical protein
MRPFRSIKIGLIASILAVFCLTLPFAALAQDCASTNPPSCSYVPVGQTLTVAPSFAYPSPSCKTVTNVNCPATFMVPTLNQAEWSKFVSYPPPNCSRLDDCDTYSWAAGGWNTCSATCGGGTQSRSISCQQTDITNGLTSTVANGYCSGGAPAASQTCNTQACVYYSWTGWGGCSSDCGGGYQYRTCYGSDGSVDYSGNSCGGSTYQQCNTQQCVSYYWSDWSGCSASCGGGNQWRSCVGTDGTSGNPDYDCGGSSSQSCNTQSCLPDCGAGAGSCRDSCGECHPDGEVYRQAGGSFANTHFLYKCVDGQNTEWLGQTAPAFYCN